MFTSSLLTKRIAARPAQWHKYSSFRHYSNGNKGGQSTRNWKLATGAAVTIIGMVAVLAPGRKNANSTKTGDSPNVNKLAEQRGLLPNTESIRASQSDTKMEGDNKYKGNTVEELSDAKGHKKRISSEAGLRQGRQGKALEDDSEDNATASKPVAGRETMSGKQEGLSNTDTKHSTDITNNSDFSQKSEGGPETSKSKGTVDSRRTLA